MHKALGWSVELVERPRKPAPKDVLMSWAQEWTKEGVELDWQKLLPLRGFQVLPRRWVVERSFAWIGHTRRMSKDYERLCSTSEAFVYAAIIRLCRHCSMEAIPSQQTTARSSCVKSSESDVGPTLFDKHKPCEVYLNRLYR